MKSWVCRKKWLFYVIAVFIISFLIVAIGVVPKRTAKQENFYTAMPDTVLPLPPPFTTKDSTDSGSVVVAVPPAGERWHTSSFVYLNEDLHLRIAVPSFWTVVSVPHAVTFSFPSGTLTVIPGDEHQLRATEGWKRISLVSDDAKHAHIATYYKIDEVHEYLAAYITVKTGEKFFSEYTLPLGTPLLPYYAIIQTVDIYEP